METNYSKKLNSCPEELNLCELLKGCEGMSVFLPDDGDVTIDEVRTDEIVVVASDGQYTHLCYETTEIQPTGFAFIYPSRGSFLDQPLDARAAWMEWDEGRKPKRWRAGEKGEYWLIETDLAPTRQKDDFIIFDDDNYEAGNYFRTQEEAARAAEVVREALAKFHQENAEK